MELGARAEALARSELPRLVASASMSTARAEILGRIRRALRDVPSHERAADVAVPRDYRRRTAPGTREELIERLDARLRDYRAAVRRAPARGAAAAVGAACAELGLNRVVAPRGLPAQWRPPGVEVVEDHGLEVDDLDAINAALTGCAVAIAET